MKGFRYKEFRSQLANDLENIPHQQRNEAIKSEQKGWRYQLAMEAHKQDIAQKMADRKIKRTREEIVKEKDNVLLSDLVRADQNLAKSIEVFDLDVKGPEICIVRDKSVPELAFLVWSKMKNNSGTRGRIVLKSNDERLPESEINLSFRSVCACCPSERAGIDSPFADKKPKYPDFANLETEKGINESVYKNQLLKEYEESLKTYKNLDEGLMEKIWFENLQKNFHKAVQKSVANNSIEFLVMRNPEQWGKNYGELNGVTLVEITNDNNIREIIEERKNIDDDNYHNPLAFRF